MGEKPRGEVKLLLCPSCNIDMVLKKAGPDGPVFVCVNPRCPAHDRETVPAKENIQEKKEA